jgi:GNAT superfamily N-acetyltransferase
MVITDLDAFIRRRTTEITLRDGARVRIRPIMPSDKDGLAQAVERASPELRYRRFMAPIHRLTEAQLRYLTEIDYVDHFAWLAIAADEPDEPGIGVARYVRLADEHDAAEAAVAVLDAYQRRGLGTLLLEALALRATQNGIKRFRGTALATNSQILDLLTAFGAVFSPPSGGEIAFELELPSRIEELRASPLYEALRAAARAPEPVFRHPPHH